eukprot:Skav216250  [mRNA]  locus=scaffold20:155749:162907:- [translate_table: standard]
MGCSPHGSPPMGCSLAPRGSLESWGDPLAAPGAPGAGSGSIASVVPSHSAFAGRTCDGEVLAWGSPHGGGDCHWDGDGDGSVVTWGMPRGGGDSSTVQASDVVAISSTDYAFAALRSDGTVVCWGDAQHGGEVPPAVQDPCSLAALCADGHVVSWGTCDSRKIQEP